MKDPCCAWCSRIRFTEDGGFSQGDVPLLYVGNRFLKDGNTVMHCDMDEGGKGLEVQVWKCPECGRYELFDRGVRR